MSKTPLLDINHPRSLLPRWRDEAQRMHEHATAPNCPQEAAQIFLAIGNTLRDCAVQLENRLVWSAMMDP